MQNTGDKYHGTVNTEPDTRKNNSSQAGGKGTCDAVVRREWQVKFRPECYLTATDDGAEFSSR